MIKRKLLIPGGAAVVAAVIVALLVATGGSAKNAPHVAPGAAVGVKQTALGRTLVDANGRTLYLFEADKPNRSTLSRAATPPAYGY